METISHDLSDLSAFHWVATEGSFTRAAERLGASKALLSKQVKRLETYIGTQLFHRTTRTLAMTEEGALLLKYSQKIFALSNEAGKQLRDMNQGISGLIRISAPLSVGEMFFPSFLARMKKVLPSVKFELDLSNDNRDFDRDEVTFAIRATSDHRSNLIAAYLGRIRDAICVNPEYFRKITLKNSPEQLSQEECILNSLDHRWNTWIFTSKSGEARVEVTGNYAANQYTTARLLCLAGLGVARLPLYLVADDVRAGHLLRLFSDYEITTHPLYLVYLQSEYPSRKHQIVKAEILRWFKEQRVFFI